MPEDVGEEYASSLADLTCNSKPLINMLTMLAEENYEHAPIIVQVIERHLQKAKPEYKLPCLYLVDSIVKNIGKDYVKLVTQNIVTTFCSVFEKVDEATRAQLFKLRSTWNEIFPSKKLYAIDLRVKSVDPAWPITAPCPSSSIHLNPKFLPTHASQVSASHGSVPIPPKDTAALRHVPVPAPSAVPGVPASTSVAPEITEVEMREHLLNKQKELLELEQKKVELELLQVKARLEQRQRELSLRLAAEQLMTGTGNGTLANLPPPAITQNVDEQLAASILAIQKLTAETDSLSQKMEATKTITGMESAPFLSSASRGVSTPGIDSSKLPLPSPMPSFDLVTSVVRGDPRLGYKNGVEHVASSDINPELIDRHEFGLSNQESFLFGQSSVVPTLGVDVKSAETGFNYTIASLATSKSNKLESHSKLNNKKRDSRDRGSSRDKDRTSNSKRERDRDRSGHRSGRERDRDNDKDGTKKRDRDREGRDHRKRERKDSTGTTEEDRVKAERTRLKTGKDSLVSPPSTQEDRVDMMDTVVTAPASTSTTASAVPYTRPDLHVDRVSRPPLPSIKDLPPIPKLTSAGVAPAMGSTVVTMTGSRGRGSMEVSRRDPRLHSLGEGRRHGSLNAVLLSVTVAKECLKEDVQRHGRSNGDEAVELGGKQRKNSKDAGIPGMRDVEPIGEDNFREGESSLMGQDGSRMHDFDLRPPVAASPKRRMSGEEGASDSKKRKSDLLEDLFGSEDVDLRQLPSSRPVDVPTPPMPPSSISPSAGAGWPPRQRPVSDSAPPVNLPAGRNRPGFGGRTQTRFSALEEGWNSPSNLEDGSGSPANLDIILNQAEEQHRNGMLDDGELGTIIKQVMEVNETKMLREVQRREGRANKENWSDKPGMYPMGMDERMSGPMPSMGGQGPHGMPGWEDESVATGGGMHGGRMSGAAPFIGGRGAPRDPRYRTPMPSGGGQGGQHPPRPFFPPTGGPMFDARGPNPPGGFGPMGPPARHLDGPRFDMCEEDPMKTINIDNMPREIRFYGDTAIILMSAEDPRELSFHPGSRLANIDGIEIECRLGDGYREFTYDGQLHRVKLGAPTREVIVDGKWYECLFGGPPILVTLDGGKQVPLRLSGPSPTVKIGDSRRADLVLGKVNMIVNARDVIPVYLDGKTQWVNVGGKTVSLRFKDSLRAVVVDEKSYNVHFGGLPEPMWIDGRRHYVRFSALPRGVEPGMVNIIGMEGEGPMNMPYARDEHQKPPLHPRTHLDFLANNMTTPVSAVPAAGGYQFQDAPLHPMPSLSVGGLPPAAEASNIPSTQVTDVSELLAKLAASGLLPQMNAPKDEEKKPVKPKKEEETLKEITFTTDGLKMRHPALISLMHLGMQCSSCGLRFPPELTLRYSQHLDWHFRQNRRERDAAKKAQSRKWYYQLSDWLLFEETEDVEDKGQSYFDSQPGEREEEKEEQASIPVGDKPEDNQCAVCHEDLEQFYNEESEEWHLKDAVRVEIGTYHRLCYQDHLTLKSAIDKEEIEPEDNHEEVEDIAGLAENGQVTEGEKTESDKAEGKVDERAIKTEGTEPEVTQEVASGKDEERKASTSEGVGVDQQNPEESALESSAEHAGPASNVNESLLQEAEGAIQPEEEISQAEKPSAPIVPPSWFDPSLLRIKEEPRSPEASDVRGGEFTSESVVVKQERMDVNEASLDVPSEELGFSEGTFEKQTGEGGAPSEEIGIQAEENPEPTVTTPVVPEAPESVSHIISSSIDGNLDMEATQVSAQTAPTKIRINFSFNKTVTSTTVASPAVPSPVPPVSAASPEKPSSRPVTPADPEKTAGSASKAGTPVPPEQAPEAAEQDFIPPVMTDEMLANKPKLQGKKLEVLPLEKRGTELSGLCSIM